MGHSPVFSVIIPTHNRAVTISPTLHSVQKQIFSDFECLIVDDGSQDGALLEDVVSKLDTRKNPRGLDGVVIY